jgi:hypothetical protein
MGTFNGWLNGTPQNDDVGPHHINVSVNDGNGGVDWREFTLVVENTNDQPQLSPAPPAGIVDEDQEYSVFFQCIDIDPVSTTFQWSLETEAAWLTLNGNHLHGTPRNDDVGIHRVNVTVRDGEGGMDWIEYSIDVFNTNDNPYFTIDSIPAAIEDQEFEYLLEAEDPDPTGDELTWNIVMAPDWVTIDHETETLIGTPTNDDVGTRELTVSVSDDKGGSSTFKFDITVVNTNDDPLIMTEPLAEVYEDDEYYLRLSASDIDPGTTTFQWFMDTNASWLALDIDTLKGVPDNSDVGFYYVNITVHDGDEGRDNLYFIINVTNTNDPPRIISDPVAFATEDILYTMQFEVEDVDFGDSLQWTLSGPDWLNIDPDTGLVNGTPTNDDVGLHLIEVTVSDLYEESDSKSFILEVQNTNDAPEWEIIPINTNMTEEDLLTTYASAEDSDDDTLTYSISSNPELDINIDPSSGMIVCNMPQPGSYVITATATDGIETIETVFHINVSEVPEVIIPTEETDYDSDGMPDWWEDLHDLDPEDPSDANEDIDGDGITNLEEFKGRTSPLEDNSEPEGKGTSPVFFIIIAFLAILVIVFLVLLLLKGSGKEKPKTETEDVAESDQEVNETNNETTDTVPKEQEDLDTH